MMLSKEMRVRGLEPPPGCPDMALNHARLPVPPHPLAVSVLNRKSMRNTVRVNAPTIADRSLSAQTATLDFYDGTSA